MIPEVVEWNRVHLKHLNGSLLEDPRVIIRSTDVIHLLREAEPKTYDAILLDVDNGPMPMVSEENAALYSRNGIRSICRALKSDGRIVVWSAGSDQKFENRLGKAGLEVESVRAKAHEGAKSPSYLLYLAEFARPSE
jgi:spermidine synthase